MSVLGLIRPADDGYTWRYLEKLPNQIKSRNRCFSELNTFQRLISKDIIALFILHVSRPAQPLPLPQTTYEACCSGWLWNGLTSLACISLEMKLLIFKVLSFILLPQFVPPCLVSFPLFCFAFVLCFSAVLRSLLFFISKLLCWINAIKADQLWTGSSVVIFLSSQRYYLLLRDELTFILSWHWADSSGATSCHCKAFCDTQ